LSALVLICFLLLSSPILPMTLSASPEPPNLLFPEPGQVTTGESRPPLGNPLFQWEPVNGASRYQIQVSRSAGFGVIEHEATTYATSYVPTVSLADGIYYWRVRTGAGNDWSVYSSARSFSKDWCSGGALRPSLESPPDGAIREILTYPDFSWSPVPGAATYLLEVDDDASFIGTPSYSCTVIKTTHTPPTKLGNSVYYWRVTPIDPKGNSGTASDISSFIMQWNRQPTLLQPLDNATPSFTPTFSWVAMPGASHYVLEISTNLDFSANVTTYLAKNTSYTPVAPLGNDQDYYWRVRAVDSAGNNSPYSEKRSFEIRWHETPRLLTPLNNQVNVGAPFFSWAPVPGAKSYHIQADETSSFAPPLKMNETVYTTFYAYGNWGSIWVPGTYYWRVCGVDDAGNETPWSEPRAFTFGLVVSAEPIYPPYYYEPQTDLLPVHGDPTIQYPLFVWDTALDQSAVPYPGADYYLLEVDDDPLFASVNFSITTLAQAASPTLEHPFANLVNGRLYYWRVQAFRGGQPMGAEVVWRTRIDTASNQIPATDQIALMYPANGHETVEHAPILGWQPVRGASRYHVQIARASNFAELVDEAHPLYINYVPNQGRTARLPNGTYYWRVRTEIPSGAWSEVRCFHINHRLLTGLPAHDYVLPSPISIDPMNTVATDPVDGLGALELTGLYAALERTVQKLSWVFALEVGPNMGQDTYYGFYFDADHLPGSGGNRDPLAKQITVSDLYLPEYALYVRRSSSGAFDRADFWEWSSLGWGAPRNLRDMFGDWRYITTTGVLELRVPDTALTTKSNWPGSVAVAAFTTADGIAGLADSVPSNPANRLDSFAFISDMLTPIYPFDTPVGGPTVYYDIPPMRWLRPSWDSVDGYQVQVSRDFAFTDISDDWTALESETSPLYSYVPNAFIPTRAFADNETYYWRVRVRHERYTSRSTDFHYGPWSRPFRFKLDSRVPANLSASPTDSTPTFNWDRVEGVGAYRLQVDDDVNFSSPLIDLDTGATSYTPLEGAGREAMRDGIYYWRVAIKRDRNNYGKWSATQTFTKTSISPVPEFPLSGQVINGLPTLRWREVLSPTGTPYISTARYKVTIADNPSMDKARSYTTSATAFTPLKGQKYADGTWYWKVATLDRNGIEGSPSPIQSFYKEYLTPTLMPLAGPDSGIPIFQWTPIPGAAYYQVQIDDNPGFSHVINPVRTDNTSYVPTRDLRGATVFYWRVWMVDADGAEGPKGGGLVDRHPFKVRLPLLNKAR
jgi:hypothetical protein